MIVRSLLYIAIQCFAIGLQAQFAPGISLSAEGGGPPLRAVDVDGDTDLDLLGLYDTKHFRWNANTDGNGDLSIALDVVSATEPIGLWSTGDLNGDALQDIVFLDGSGTNLWWFENEGDALFAAPLLIGTLPMAATKLLLADITGEGRPDVIATIDQDPGGDVVWFPNTFGGFGALDEIEIDLAGGSTMLLSADLDLSGGNDLVVSNWNQVVFTLKNIAGDATTWQVDTIVEAPGYAYESASILIDVDNDGDQDLAESGAVALHWAENHIGEGGAWSQFTDHVMEPWTSAGNGAFGHLGCNAATGLVFVPSFPVLPVRWSAWVDDLADFAYRADLAGVERGGDLLLADLTGDGKDDLVLNHPDGTAWYRNILQPATTTLQLPALDTLCMFGAPVPLPEAVPAGGRWNGFGVDQGIFYRSNVNGTGTYALNHAVYEDQGCPIGGTASVFVTEQPQISPALSSPLCSDGTPIQLSSVPAATEWIGVGPDAVLDPATFSGNVVVAVYTDATGEVCAAESEPIEVWDALNVAINPSGPYCITDGPQLITAAAQPPLGVEWSGDIVSWNSSGATFDPAIGAGDHIVVLHAEPTMPFQCPGADTLVIQVSDVFPVVATIAMDPQCAAGTPIGLVEAGSPVGGLWSGPGVIGDTLFPAQLGAGNYNLTYTVFDPGGCAASELLAVDLVDQVSIEYAAEDLIFCEGDTALTLLAAPPGGTWSAPVNVDGVLDPSSLSVGQYPLVYEWAGENGCLLTNTPMTIERWSTTVVTIDPIGVLCDDDQATLITGSPAGEWTGAAPGSGTFTLIEPALLGAGIWPVTLTAADPGACPGSTTLDILIEICTGATEPVNRGISVAPNPSDGQFTIEAGVPATESVEVLDAAGRLLLSTRPTATGRTVVDLAGALPGTYLLRVIGTDGSLWSTRIVKL